MIGVALLQVLLLSSTLPAASAQYIFTPGGIAAPLAIASLAVSGIFTFLFVLQLVHCIVAIIIMRGHRMPYLVLFPTIAFAIIWSLATIAYDVVVALAEDIYLRIALAGVLLFFRNWTLVLIYTALVVFLLDRQTTIRTKSNGASGGQNAVLVVVHIGLALTMLALATAQASASVNLRLMAAHGLSRSDSLGYIQRVNTTNALDYAFYAVVIVSTVDVIVTAVLLSGAAKKASISDKVTNTFLFAVSPLYALLNLSHLVFLIVLSPSGLPKGRVTLSKVTAIRNTDLAQHVIEYLLVFLIFAVLLFMTFNRKSWDIGSTDPTPTQQGQQYPAPQVVQYQNQPYPQQPYVPHPYGMQTPPPQPYTVPSSPQPYPQYAAPQPYPPYGLPQPQEYTAPQAYLQQDSKSDAGVLQPYPPQEYAAPQAYLQQDSKSDPGVLQPYPPHGMSQPQEYAEPQPYVPQDSKSDPGVLQPYPPHGVSEPQEYAAPQVYMQHDASQQEWRGDRSPQGSPPPVVQYATSK